MAASKRRWKCPEQWSEWSDWLAAGLHARNRWRLPVLLKGILFASGRRTVTTWLRAAGVECDYQDYYYFLAAVGSKTESIASQLVLLVLRVLPLPERLLRRAPQSPAPADSPQRIIIDHHSVVAPKKNAHTDQRPPDVGRVRWVTSQKVQTGCLVATLGSSRFVNTADRLIGCSVLGVTF